MSHHLVECLELGAAAYGGLRLVLDLVRARRRRRVHRDVKRASAPIPPVLRCPTPTCIGHGDNPSPAYLRGHPQPCWDGLPDPRRGERV
jgi:hypothetical protein